MNARSRLNSIYTREAFCCAAVLGATAQSWTLFITIWMSVTLALTALGRVRPSRR